MKCPECTKKRCDWMIIIGNDKDGQPARKLMRWCICGYEEVYPTIFEDRDDAIKRRDELNA